MGVKTKITTKDLKNYFSIDSLKPTLDGERDSVYIINDSLVLKLFENPYSPTIKEEIKLNTLCRNLKVAPIKKRNITIKNKPALIYKKCTGTSLKKVKLKHIKEIGKFLKQFHTITKNKKSQNSQIFAQKPVQKMVKDSTNPQFKKLYKKINIKLKNDGIIHGDIFRDNVLFKNNKISCVIDFTEACNGDFDFDLAVIGLDWCKGDKELKVLLESYGATISLKKFKHYIRYAGLYYSLIRYYEKRDYKKLLKRIKRL